MIGGLFNVVRPGLMMFDAETAHQMTLTALALAPLPAAAKDDARLTVFALGTEFSNPVGLAAGFDKNAEVADRMLALGFGFVEVGAVTPKPQPGNPRPRVFRLGRDQAVINRYGFNSEGVDAVAARLKRRQGAGIVGVNLGANKDSADRAGDYETLVRRLAGDAAFLTANISSPNTPGLRSMQARAEFDDLLARVMAARDQACEGRRPTPLLVKIAPDLSDGELDDIVAVARARRVDGMIVSNTTISRPSDLVEAQTAKETGGLSGRPLFRLSTQMLAKTALRVEQQFPLIGVGGIDSAEAAITKFQAGASLVQLYTALVYRGPALIGEIKAGILRELDRRRCGMAGLTGLNSSDIAAGRF